MAPISIKIIIEECSDNKFLAGIGNCVQECPDGTYKFFGNYTCLKLCQSNYEANNEEKKCVIKSYEKTSSKEFKNEILNNITSFVNSSSLINGSDFIAVVLDSNEMDPKEQIKKGISAIDLGNCNGQIKEYYNISKDEPIIILNMESKRNESNTNIDNNNNAFDIGKNNIYYFYNFNICKYIIITLIKNEF